jgi:hypothetical protein
MFSDFDKSQCDLVHEISINRERVNAAGEGARRLFIENDRLKQEQRAQAELYVRALRDRNDLEAQLKAAVRLTDRTAALEAELKGARDDRASITEAYRNAMGALYVAARGRDQLANAILSGATRKTLRDLARQLEAEQNL